MMNDAAKEGLIHRGVASDTDMLVLCLSSGDLGLNCDPFAYRRIEVNALDGIICTRMATPKALLNRIVHPGAGVPRIYHC